MSGFFHLVYVSSAVAELSDEQLAEILEVARRNNAASGITGMLIYAGGNFLQVLEGRKAEVLETIARIERDPRHKGLIHLLKADTAERYFPEWSMGFKSIDPREMAEIPGYRDLRNLSLRDLESTAHKLIRQFMRHMAGVG
jgi:hypothetical protein